MNIHYDGDLKTKYVHKIVLLTCPFLEHLLLEASRVGDENTSRVANIRAQAFGSFCYASPAPRFEPEWQGH